MKAAGQRINRSRSLRGSSSPEQSGDSTLHSTASVFRLILHFIFCVASLILGFRLSRESLLVVVSLKGSDSYLHQVANTLPTLTSTSDPTENKSLFQDPLLPLSEVKAGGLYHGDGVKSSRVHVGRHGILIRPWPHPDPVETMMAHTLIARVQQEQRKLYGLTERRPIIVITPTFPRTFQALHLSSLMHTLMLVPGPLSWIVVEAGERSAETASILSKSGLEYHHLYLPERMSASWAERRRMEVLLRIRGLRFVRDNELEGIVVFADESNSHRLELFDEVQNVRWVGAISVGLLMPPEVSDQGNELLRWNSLNVADASTGFLPVQGPACNVSGHLIGWHSETGTVSLVRGAKKMLPQLEWAGFVLNSAAILDVEGRPNWIKDFDTWVPQNGIPLSPTALVTDEKYIEPLGSCGRDVLLWWARVEARADSKYPQGWMSQQESDVVVSAKRTPWPDPPPPPPFEAASTTDDQLSLSEKKKQEKQSRSRRVKKKQSKGDS